MTVHFRPWSGIVANCPVCGDEFGQRNKTHQFCQRSCAAKARFYKNRIKWEMLNLMHAGWNYQFEQDLTFELIPPKSPLAVFPSELVIRSDFPDFGENVGWLTEHITVSGVLAAHFGEFALAIEKCALMTWKISDWGDPEPFWALFVDEIGLNPLTWKCEMCQQDFINLDLCFDCSSVPSNSDIPKCVCISCGYDRIPF